MNYERSFHRKDSYAFKIGGTSSHNRDTIEPYLIGKGGGSAYGGELKPSKPDDRRFIGDPGSINRTTDRSGNLRETMIGAGGRAAKERHYSDHVGFHGNETD